MRILDSQELAAISGGATTASPLVTVPLALFNGAFTVINILISLPAALTYRR
ncbi:MAG: hypothetical protein QM742_18845 [Aquabacterium sp.]